VASLSGAVQRHARRRDPTEAETAAAVNELKEILAGRNDAAVLLAATAGLMLGFREGTPDEPRARTAARFCLEAGAGEDLIQGGSPRESAGPRWRGGHRFRAACAR